ADLRFVDPVGGKRMDIAKARHQRFVADVAGKLASASGRGKRVGLAVVDITPTEDAEKAVLGTDLVIDTDVERVLIVTVDWIVAKQVAEAGCRRREKLDDLRGHGVETRPAGDRTRTRRNYVRTCAVVPHKLVARRRVNDGCG